MGECWIRRFGEDVHTSALELSGLFATAVTAPQQVGRLVKVLWKANRRYFMTQPDGWLISDIKHRSSYHVHPRENGTAVQWKAMSGQIRIPSKGCMGKCCSGRRRSRSRVDATQLPAHLFVPH